VVQKIKKIVLIFLCGITFLGAKQLPSFLKPKKVTKIKSPAKLKELIGYELEDMLTLSADLIAFLADGQRNVIKKMHTLFAPEKGDMFSEAKAKQLDIYLQQLKVMHQELERTERSIKKEFANFSKNFNT
jgi:hypothetical protein